MRDDGKPLFFFKFIVIGDKMEEIAEARKERPAFDPVNNWEQIDFTRPKKLNLAAHNVRHIDPAAALDEIKEGVQFSKSLGMMR